MTITNGYCTLADLKHTAALNIPSTDSGDDDLLEAIIEAVSRQIDDECGRRFFSDSDEVPRYYTALSPDKLFVDDICSPTSDVTIEIDAGGDGTYETTLASTDFILAPYNAETLGEPYQKIEMSSSGLYYLPVNSRKAIKVTSKYGWSSVPKPIQKACLLQSERLYKRYSTPIGSEAMTALGKQTLMIPAFDADIERLISRYKKVDFG